MSEEFTILNLPWEDVICKQLLCYLTLKDVYRLKRVSSVFKSITELYMEHFCRALDFTSIGSSRKFHGDIFLDIVGFKTNIVQLNFKDCKSWLRDDHLLPVLNSNHNLMDLFVTDCYGLSDITFLAISQNLLQLNNLDLSLCRDLSDNALVSIGEGLCELRSLDVSGCWHVNDTGIVAVALHNASLSTLRTKSCYAITDISLTAVAKNCRQLKELDIRGCWRVKDVSVIAIREYCQELKLLYVKECTGVTELSLARMRPKGILLDIEMPLYRGFTGIPLVNKMPLLQI